MQRRLALFAPIVLAGCGSLLPKQKYIPRINWPLNPPPPVENAANPAGLILLVRDISAAPGLDQQGVQSINPDGSLQVDYYNLWAVNPADAVTQALLVWAQASGDFSAVVSTGSRLTASLILEGELTELVADVAAAQARAVLTLAVIKNSSSFSVQPLPLAQERIVGTAPLSGTTAAAEVAGQRAALASALAQAVALVTRYTD